MTLKHSLYLGTFIHCKTRQTLEYFHDTAVCVDSQGKIVAVKPDCDRTKAENDIYPKLGWQREHVIVTACGPGQFFFPGFIDTHIHAAQYPNTGLFGSTTLLDWLDTYTFPIEASLSDVQKARRVYTACIRRTLAHGTTTATYYATIDVATTNLLADLCRARGQRAFVGRVAMDRPGFCPDYYRDADAASALAKTEECIGHVEATTLAQGGSDLVSPIITPRFALSSTPELLRSFGDLAAAKDLRVQTHISENRGEIELVREVFGGLNYAGVYDAAGLLTPRTVLAHAVWLTDEEARLVAKRGAKVSHCPCSNSSLTSGAARVRWLWDHGVCVGLGTDISGGYSPSVLESARQASLVSRHVAMGEAGDSAKLSVEEVLFLATRGGAEVLGLEARVAGFEVGKEWDAQLVGLGQVKDMDVEDDDNGHNDDGDDEGDVECFGWETWAERIAKWVFNGDDRNTKAVWVSGKLVHARKGKKDFSGVETRG